MNIINTLRNSNSELLKAEGKDLSKWSKLKHNKQDFELFLNFNLAEISFRTKDGLNSSIICTSNTTFIKLFEIKKNEDKIKISKIQSDGIRTKDKKSINTWDLIDNKLKTINLTAWQIENFISITPDNILILHELVSEILKK